MHDEFDDTVTVPPRLPVERTAEPVPDADDTVVRPVEQYPLVEPPRDWATAEIDLPAPAQEPAEDYFRFRIGRTIYWLDAVTYVGRRPGSPRIQHGQVPRLIRVFSPRQEVSGTHVELRQLGASVVLTDMRSTNGSVVRPPGAPAFKLRQGESVVVSPGTLVDIGDGNVLEILLRSRVGSDGDTDDDDAKDEADDEREGEQ